MRYVSEDDFCISCPCDIIDGPYGMIRVQNQNAHCTVACQTSSFTKKERRHFFAKECKLHTYKESAEKFIHIRVPTCVISSLYVDLHVFFFLFFQEDSPSCDIFEEEKKCNRKGHVAIQIRLFSCMNYSRNRIVVVAGLLCF